MIFGDILKRNGKIFGDQEGLVFKNRRYTYAQMLDRVNRFSNALINLGVQKGDRIAVLQENCNQYVELYFSIAAAGAVIVPLNYRLNPKEMVMILKDSGASVLCFSIDFQDAVQEIKPMVNQLKHFILTDATNNDYLYYEDLLEGASADDLKIKIEENDNFCILYTSGTVSTPKGVVLSHKNVIANVFNQCMELNIQPGSTNLQLSPLYHASNSHVFCHVFVHGKNILLKHFDPDTALDTIDRERVTYFFAVPTMIYGMLDSKDIDNYDLKSLQTIVYGGASMTDNRLEESVKKFGYILAQAYGLTETTSHSSVLSKEEHKVVKNSIGRGMFGVEVQVVNDAGMQLKTGEIGEIVVRGDTVLKEYWNRPELTEESRTDGWFHTGDLGKVDEEGYIYVVDRKKDLIISGGVNIYPRDIEEVIAKHPAVAEVAVFGVSDDKWGESVKAVIILRSGKKVSEQEIIDFCGKQIARYKRPKSVDIVDELPKTASGKILKRDLRKRYAK